MLWLWFVAVLILLFCDISRSLETMNKLTLGSLVLKSRILLSPLEGVSDVGFRSLCFDNGAALTWTEMVRAAGIIKNNAATLALIDTYDPNVPTGIQLVVKSPKELLDALTKLETLANTNPNMQHFHNICAIDLNFGCPSKDIINIGCGPAMLKRKTKLSELFQALTTWKQHTTLKNIQAVGCKIRLGLNPTEQENKVYLQITELANEAKLDYLTVHARHAMQRSSSPAYWPAIKEIKEHATIPIIGNGDVWTQADMAKMQQITGCDAVMVARTAIRNPWIFRDLSQGVDNQSIPSVQEVEQAIVLYEQSCAKYAVKPKYAQFNLANLQRIRQELQAGNVQYAYKGPKTVHMS